MRTRMLFTLLAALSTSAVLAEEAPSAAAKDHAEVAAAETQAAHSKPPHRTVYLGGVASLERLREDNMNHYLRAQRILAAADELCRPGPEVTTFVRFEASDISCSSLLLKTSYPPKREIGFTLDDLRYIALVTVTDASPRFMPAR
ncbi:MAG: hypothetical protein IRZ28_18505 [Steroidobacteraceae bacterium]|nr:hypothetical protein [Steroidobacteraceae bacterium]